MIDHDAYDLAERQRREQIHAERIARVERQRIASQIDHAARLERAFLDLNDPPREQNEAAS